jgi:hypothetical protein
MRCTSPSFVVWRSMCHSDDPAVITAHAGILIMSLDQHQHIVGRSYRRLLWKPNVNCKTVTSVNSPKENSEFIFDIFLILSLIMVMSQSDAYRTSFSSNDLQNIHLQSLILWNTHYIWAVILFHNTMHSNQPVNLKEKGLSTWNTLLSIKWSTLTVTNS